METCYWVEESDLDGMGIGLVLGDRRLAGSVSWLPLNFYKASTMPSAWVKWAERPSAIGNPHNFEEIAQLVLRNCPLLGRPDFAR